MGAYRKEILLAMGFVVLLATLTTGIWGFGRCRHHLCAYYHAVRMLAADETDAGNWAHELSFNCPTNCRALRWGYARLSYPKVKERLLFSLELQGDAPTLLALAKDEGPDGPAEKAFIDMLCGGDGLEFKFLPWGAELLCRDDSPPAHIPQKNEWQSDSKLALHYRIDDYEVERHIMWVYTRDRLDVSGTEIKKWKRSVESGSVEHRPPGGPAKQVGSWRGDYRL